MVEGVSEVGSESSQAQMFLRYEGEWWARLALACSLGLSPYGQLRSLVLAAEVTAPQERK